MSSKFSILEVVLANHSLYFFRSLFLASNASSDNWPTVCIHFSTTSGPWISISWTVVDIAFNTTDIKLQKYWLFSWISQNECHIHLTVLVESYGNAEWHLNQFPWFRSTLPLSLKKPWSYSHHYCCHIRVFDRSIRRPNFSLNWRWILILFSENSFLSKASWICHFLIFNL